MNAGRGVSLIELLVVMLIVAVLAAAAAPAWHDHVIRTRRHEAQATLQRLMLQQERYFTQHGSYVAFSAATADQAPQFQWWSGAAPQASGYEIAGQACDGDTIELCVQLVAMPGTARVDAHFRDPGCDQLTLTSTGQRLARGPLAHCWR